MGHQRKLIPLAEVRPRRRAYIGALPEVIETRGTRVRNLNMATSSFPQRRADVN